MCTTHRSPGVAPDAEGSAHRSPSVTLCVETLGRLIAGRRLSGLWTSQSCSWLSCPFAPASPRTLGGSRTIFVAASLPCIVDEFNRQRHILVLGGGSYGWSHQQTQSHINIFTTCLGVINLCQDCLQPPTTTPSTLTIVPAAIPTTSPKSVTTSITNYNHNTKTNNNWYSAFYLQHKHHPLSPYLLRHLTTLRQAWLPVLIKAPGCVERGSPSDPWWE